MLTGVSRLMCVRHHELLDEASLVNKIKLSGVIGLHIVKCTGSEILREFFPKGGVDGMCPNLKCESGKKTHLPRPSRRISQCQHWRTRSQVGDVRPTDYNIMHEHLLHKSEYGTRAIETMANKENNGREREREEKSKYCKWFTTYVSLYILHFHVIGYQPRSMILRWYRYYRVAPTVVEGWLKVSYLEPLTK